MPDAFEFGEVGDWRTAVAGAGGDDHGSRAHGIAVGELKLERAAGFSVGAAAFEPRHFERNGDLGAELQGLVEGPSRQGKAGDASWEAEIVLDPRRRTRLSAEGTAVEHQHGKPL